MLDATLAHDAPLTGNFNTAAILDQDREDGPRAVLDQNRRDTDAPDPAFSASDHARAASFGAVAERAGEGNERLERGADLYGEWSIGPGFAAPLRELNGIEYTLSGKRLHDDDGDGKDDDDYTELSDAMDRVAETQRKEWAREEHSYAGMKMSGEEWGKFGDELSGDTPLHEWLIDQIKMKENKTDAEAKKEADQIALLAKMQSLPKDQWTPDMKKLDQELNQHPDERTKYNEYFEDIAEHRSQIYGRADTLEKTSSDATRTTSVAARSDALGEQPFANAPKPGPAFAAVAPPPKLDTAITATPEMPDAPVQIATKTPTPVPPNGTGGFDYS